MMGALLMLVFTGGLQAQEAKPPVKKQKHEQKTPGQRADMLVGKMEKVVGLDAKQRAAVHHLALTRAQQMQDLRRQYKGTQADKKTIHAERRKINVAFNTGLKSTLSAKQYDAWEKYRKEQRANHKAKKKMHKSKKHQPGR